jgi:hypothetical protein
VHICLLVCPEHPAGDSHCFPKYRAAVVEKPTFACGDQYSLNHTKLGAACVKRTFTKTNNCFKSLRCPSTGNYNQTDHIWWVSCPAAALVRMRCGLAAMDCAPHEISARQPP